MEEMKKGIFFSVDAVIALALIFLMILIAFPLFSESKPNTEVHADILETLSTLTVGNIDSAYVQTLRAEGSLPDEKKSILEAIGDLYVVNVTKAHILADEMINSLDVQENVGIWYGNTLLASRNVTPYETAQKVDTARQIISGIREGESVTGFSAKAHLQSKQQTKYTYIGGYVGEGNVTLRVTYNGTLQNASLEAATNKDFLIVINNQSAGSYTKSPSVLQPTTYTLPSALFTAGENIIELKASNLSITGGFVKVTYNSTLEYEQPRRYYFPGVSGIINVYDGFFVPGTLKNLSLSLHYKTPYNAFITIGNTTILNQSSANESVHYLSDNQLKTLLNYAALSNRSVPLRIGLENISLTGSGVASIDVVLITDISGSMDWRLNNDATGTARNCNHPLINASSTKRISLAKCLDKEFVATILNSSTDSRVALVSFSDDADDYISLTRNKALLNSTIEGYTVGGATCVSCAINRAHEILRTESNATRSKFIVVMTDGVTNRRSTDTCLDINAVGGKTNNEIYAAGIEGYLLKKNKSTETWSQINSPTNDILHGMSLYNDSMGFAVGANGRILRWNGVSWTAMSSPVTSALYGVDMFNETYALAVGANGRILRWNGVSWTLHATISNGPTLYGVDMFSPTLTFAAGLRGSTGRIYRSNNAGQSWSESHTGGSRFSAVKLINATRAFAVGDDGRIVQWSGSSWSQVTSGTTEDLYGIEANTSIFAVGGYNGKSIAVRYVGGSWSSSLNVVADSLRNLIVLNNKTYAVGHGGTVFHWNTSTWTQDFDIKPVYEGNSTQGISCTADQDSCAELNSFPALNANYSACRVHREFNATTYSIGFGPVESCDLANNVLASIAQCGNGSYYASSDASELQSFYQNIAQNIIQISYAEQTAQATGNISTQLYSDSYIEFTYIKNSVPFGLLLNYEKNFTNATTASFTIPANISVVDAKVISYSGPRWTARTTLNNNTIYNLDAYGSDYTKRGDPFEIHIPSVLVQEQNNITLMTGLSPTNLTSGSPYNKVIYTLLKNASGYSPIVSLSEGCTWTVHFEDESNSTLAIPQNYSGSSLCSYQPSSVSYNANDAIQEAIYRLLSSMDLDNNNKVDVRFNAQDVDIALTQIAGIPFTWSTEVQVRVWRS